ncbi:MAG: hypothetical protein WED34_22090 [Planctomycetales bacterium]
MTTQEPNPAMQVADALREVALTLELALEAGKRSTRIDAEDLRETLLAVADRLDPPHRAKAS